ncbi:amidohydrolase family protein [Chryseolinea sp. T2]|uniref:amidohydrolase family protein n=1 Tax=Chryseolinea sp. T2 TaxID=3129255 RepID=UPI0030786B6C
MIIDAHCHAGKGDGLTGPWDTNAAIRDYLKWASEYGISKTVFFAAFHSDYALANREVAKIVLANPARFYGFAFVHASRDAGRISSMIQEAVSSFGFCGIKLHRYDARITREVCETARLYALPVLYDVMGEIASVHLLAREYPDVNFIIPHLGSFADDWKAQQAFIDPLSRFPNIYTDSSGVRRFDLLKEAFCRAGANKILFGSDGPWLHPGVELEKIFALRSGENAQRRMLSENFLELISQVKLPKTKTTRLVTRRTSGHALKALVLEQRDPWLL